MTKTLKKYIVLRTQERYYYNYVLAYDEIEAENMIDTGMYLDEDWKGTEDEDTTTEKIMREDGEADAEEQEYYERELA